MYKKLFLLLLFLCTSPWLAERVYSENTYKLGQIKYDISGLTREYVLSQKLAIDTEKVFDSKEAIEEYIESINQNIENQRVIETSEIIESYSEPDSNGLITIDLLIKTRDSINFVIVPYPTYDVNTGFKLKLKIKDYNFLGSMDEFNSSLVYFLNVNEDTGATANSFDFSFGFDVPFQLGVFDCKWNNDFSLNYVLGDSNIGYHIKEGIDFNLPIFNITSLNFNLSQSLIQNPAYDDNGDLFYFNTLASFSFPLNIVDIPDVGYLTWSPGISFNFNWDKDVFSGADNFGIETGSLLGPSLTFSQRLSTGKVNWVGNLKDGFSTQVIINYSYNFTTFEFVPSINMQLERYRSFTNNAFYTRLYYFVNTNGSTSEIGGRIRGIRDNDVHSSCSLCVNFDFPFKLLQTDWVGWFKTITGKELPWLSYVDFEAQISPFVDFIIGHNNKTQSFFNIRDTYLASGIEIIGFPNKFRSIQGRLSFGVDIIHIAMLIGEDIDFVDKAINRVFETSWRTDPCWELFFGIGMHY